MKNMLNLPIDFKVKAVADDDDFLTIEGYANTTTVDRVGDIILEEAWTKGGLDNYLKNPIILAYHNHSKPIGTMIEYSINNLGLKITANIHKSVGEIYSLIKSEVLKTFSVGFRTKDADYDTDTDLFVIKDLELLEVSVVSIPANADSTFSVKKSFETDNEYNSFKSEYSKDTGTVIAEDVSDDDSENKEEKNMDPKLDKEQIEADLRAKIEKEIAEETARKEELRTEVSAQVKDAVSGTTTVVGEQVEKLQTDIEARFADEKTTMQEALDSLKQEIKEYSEELTNLNKSKMSFTNKNKGGILEIAEKDIDSAVMIAKILGRPIQDTNFGKDLLEKAGNTSDGAHQTGMTQEWEIGFSTRLFDDIREKLIIENMFTSFAMPRGAMNIPLNPEAGYGTWVVGGPGGDLAAATSSGTARTHGLDDSQLTAYKLATKELLSYEEEDDSLIPLVPIIRDAAARRMAKSSDKALLRGDATVSAGSGEGVYPFNGLTTISIDNSNEVTMGGTVASTDVTTVADMQSMRRAMGVHGHNPSDVVFVVNHDVYYDLLEDSNFLTMDKVGTQATILTGQIGKIGGSAVVVSGEFAAKDTDVPSAVAVNMSNYIKGDYKGITVERERSVENQTNLLVVTRRFGMLELFPSNPTVVALVYPAS